MLIAVIRRGGTMKTMRMTALAALLSIFGSTATQADTLTIEMLTKPSRIYSIEIARISVGDTVKWLPSAKGHNVHIRNGPDGVKVPKKSKTSKKFSMRFETPGVYFYWCTPHKGMGMLGLIVVGDDLSNLDDIAQSKTKGQSSKKLSELIAQLR